MTDGTAWLDIWTLSLPDMADAKTERHWSACLSLPERKRAAQYRDPARRQQSIAARALLRHALCQRAGGSAARWTFSATANTRPALTPPLEGLDFNVSHTAGRVGCAVSSGFAVGIDIEHRDRAADIAAVESRILATSERRIWRNLKAEKSSTYLVQLWTLKEAWAKAVGTGMATDFTSLNFDIALSGVIGLENQPDWFFDTVTLASGHIISTAWTSREVTQPVVRDGNRILRGD